MFMVDVNYPSVEEEVQIVRATTSGVQPTLDKVLAPEQIRSLQDLVLRVPAAEHVIRYAVDLVRRTRPPTPPISTCAITSPGAPVRAPRRR